MTARFNNLSRPRQEPTVGEARAIATYSWWSCSYNYSRCSKARAM